MIAGADSCNSSYCEARYYDADKGQFVLGVIDARKFGGVSKNALYDSRVASTGSYDVNETVTLRGSAYLYPAAPDNGESGYGRSIIPILVVDKNENVKIEACFNDLNICEVKAKGETESGVMYKDQLGINEQTHTSAFQAQSDDGQVVDGATRPAQSVPASADQSLQPNP